MTDNFNAYKQFITEKWEYTELPKDDSYFVVEIIRRGKDIPDMPAANYHFRNYYIRKPEDLDKYKQEIIDLCHMFKMRAYASVNIKSFKQISTIDSFNKFIMENIGNELEEGSYILIIK